MAFSAASAASGATLDMNEGLLRVSDKPKAATFLQSSSGTGNKADKVESFVTFAKRCVYESVYAICNPPQSSGSAWVVERFIIFLQVHNAECCIAPEKLTLVSADCAGPVVSAEFLTGDRLDQHNSVVIRQIPVILITVLRGQRLCCRGAVLCDDGPAGRDRCDLSVHWLRNGP